MKRRIFCCLAVCALLAAPAVLAQPRVGMTDTTAYFPLLEERRVAVLANQTSVADMPGAPGADASGRVHLVDLLHGRGFRVTGIFSPEHGFRGAADAGERVGDSEDPRTGIPIRSLYDGGSGRPSGETMRTFDVLVVDMQDVGLRFYTYHITMLRMMDACAAAGRRVIVLDRPNPNGGRVDGPVLDMKYRSGVGALPIPVLHGMPLGEARGVGFSLRYVIDAYRDLEALGEEFFTPMFEKLVGVGWVRPMIRAGASDEEIRARWQEDIARFTALRAKYLLYE